MHFKAVENVVKMRHIRMLCNAGVTVLDVLTQEVMPVSRGT